MYTFTSHGTGGGPLTSHGAGGLNPGDSSLTGVEEGVGECPPGPGAPRPAPLPPPPK